MVIATDRFDRRSLWWRHELLHRRVMADPARLLAVYAAERNEIESGWLADPPDPETAFGRADEALTRWTAVVERAGGSDHRPVWARRYWQVRNARADLPAWSPETSGV